VKKTRDPDLFELMTSSRLFATPDSHLVVATKKFILCSKLLLCVAHFNSKKSFQSFNKDVLIKLTSFYLREF
jgi:hypothetical protein